MRAAVGGRRAVCRGARMILLRSSNVLSPLLIGSRVGSAGAGSGAVGWCRRAAVSGPVVVVLALERGPVFAAQASVGAVMELVLDLAFALVYSWSAGWVGCRVRSAGFRGAGASLAGWVALLECRARCRRCRSRAMDVRDDVSHAFVTWRDAGASDERDSRRARRWWDLPLRMRSRPCSCDVEPRRPARSARRSQRAATPFPVGGQRSSSDSSKRSRASARTRSAARVLVAGLLSFAVFL